MNVAWARQEATGPTDGPVTPGDTSFPGGAALLTAAGLGEVLGEPEPDSRLVDVHYHPARSLQAVHRRGNGRVVVLDAVADPEGGEARVRVLPFPHDPGLPQLADLVADLGGRPDVLAYLPGRRAALGTADRVLKTGPAASVARASRQQQALWTAPGRRFRMARPLGQDAPRAARTEQRVAGQRLDTVLGTVDPGRLCTALARALAALHALRPEVPLADRGPAGQLQRLTGKTVRTVRRALPDLAGPAAQLVARLAEAGLPSGPPTLVHGDFHAANLLLDGDEVVLLDLDELGIGHPEADLALLVGRLVLIALQGATSDPVRAAAALDLAGALPEAYAEESRRPVDPSGYAWYLAAGLLGRQVKTCVRHLAPGLDGLAARLVALGGQVLDAGRLDPDWVRD